MICNSIPQTLRSLARQFGPKPVYVDAISGIELNLVEFKNSCWAAAFGLIAEGVVPREGVALLGFDDAVGLEFEIGCQAAAAVPFTVPTTLSMDETVNALLMSRCTRFVISDRDPVFADAARLALSPLSSLMSEIQAVKLRDERFAAAVAPGGENDDPEIEARVNMIGPDFPAAAFLHRMPDGREMVVTLSHSGIQSMAAMVSAELMADESDTWTPLLPLSSAFARIACWYAALLSGGSCSVVPDGCRPVEALFLAQPSFAVCGESTPLGIDSGITDELNQLKGLRGRITRWGFERACRRTSDGREPSGMADSLADLSVERLVRDIPGGRLRAIISNGADIDAEGRCRLLTAGIDLWTVLAPASVCCFLAVSRHNAIRAGSVGKPLEGMSVHADGAGFLSVRGPLIMIGEMCQSPWDSPDLADGALNSGYKGSVDRDGFIYIDEGAQ